jgi:hypothetical protein
LKKGLGQFTEDLTKRFWCRHIKKKEGLGNCMPKPSPIQKDLFQALAQTFQPASDRTIQDFIANLDDESA